MKINDNIQHEVEKTLQSLDGISRAEANPFLFTRIKARIQRQSTWERITSFISRPVVAIAALVLIMAVNGWAVFGIDDSSVSPENESISTTDISDEYNLIANTTYDYENMNNE